MLANTKAYATEGPKELLKPTEIARREVGSKDVQIEIDYCGICHSDVHVSHNDWGGTQYPLVPGHEIVGRVTRVGEDVKSFKVGDIVGVGCMVNSCRTCPSCKDHLEQYCENGAIMTYNSPDAILGGRTYGGYSERIVVDEGFVLHVSDKLDLKGVAPLLCAGITTYSPLRHWNVKKEDKVGIIGLGGLGHMGVKFAHAMGAHVVMITRSPKKGEDAKQLGADEVLISTDPDALKTHENSFDFLLNTIPVAHDVNPYLDLLKRDKTMVIVGAIGPLPSVDGSRLIRKRKKIAGSLIGGIKETQEMLDFCAHHNITCDIEMIKIQDINNAYPRVMKGDVKYRFVIDMASLKE